MAESTEQVLGKILAIRDMRRTRFVDVYTFSSDKLQLIISRDVYSGNLTQGDSISVIGSRGLSKTGEPSFIVTSLLHRTPYTSSSPFTDIKRVNKSELSQKVSIIESIRNYMHNNGVLEVATPIIINKFNGGSSIPMKVLGQREYGFLRATHEDQLLKIVSDLLCSVYQIGPIFKAGKELDFLEAYIINADYNAVNIFAQNFLREITNNTVEYIDFLDLLRKHLSEHDLKLTTSYLNGFTSDVPKIASITSKTGTGFCDKLVSMVSKKEGEWTGVKYLAVMHSPLYQETGDRDGLLRIERSRIYKNGRLVFDIGVNALDADSVLHRIQRTNNNIESPYIKVLQQGLPPVAGFSVRLSELM